MGDFGGSRTFEFLPFRKSCDAIGPVPPVPWSIGAARAMAELQAFKCRTEEEVEQYCEECSIDSYQKMMELLHSCYVIRKYVAPYSDLHLYMCTCPEYTKCRVCKHSLWFSMRQGEVNVPPENNIKNVGKKRRGPGRPRSLPAALVRDEA